MNVSPRQRTLLDFGRPSTRKPADALCVTGARFGPRRVRARSAATAASLLMVALVAFEAAAKDLELPRRVERYARIEFAVDVPFRGANPYDPDQVQVDALFLSPSGRRLEVPAFYYNAYDPLFDIARHDSGWKVRFTPEETGRYEVEVTVRQPEGDPQTVARGGFESVASSRRGFVRAARKPGDRLVFSNGEAYCPVGANISWGNMKAPAKYLEELDRLADSGANCVRVWTCPWWLPIEGRTEGKNERALGRYNQHSCALLDLILDKCESRGLQVILCLEQFGSYQPQGFEVGLWPRNPYNAALGGPCATTTSFFSDAQAREAFRKRLRYMAARYGYSTAILAWELFNEVEQVPFQRGTLQDNMATVESWHREMSRWLQRTDAFGHLVGTSSDPTLQKLLAHVGAVDVVFLHVLHEEDFASTVLSAVRDMKAEVGVPVVVEEFGGDRADTGFVSFPRGLYGALCGGAAGALHWSQDVPDRRIVMDLMGHAAKLTAGIAWLDEDFRPALVTDLAPRKKRVPKRFAPVVLPGVLPYGQGGPPAPAIIARPDGTVTNGRTMPRYLHGSGKPHLQRPIVLHAEFLFPGAVVVKVNTVSDQALLEVDIDGANVGKQELPTGRDNKLAKESRWAPEHMIYQDRYDREFSFAVPVGKHEIRIANSGKDWILIDYVKLDNLRLVERAQVGAAALAGRSTALVYVFGLNETWRAVQSGELGKEPQEVRFRLQGLRDGPHVVEAWDTRTGKLLQKAATMCQGGAMSLWTPPFTIDVLLRITHM